MVLCIGLHLMIDQIDPGIVWCGRLTMHFKTCIALTQHDIGERGAQIDAQPHRLCAAAAQAFF